MVATPILLPARGLPASQARWTFSYTGTLAYGGSYSGDSGVQSFTSGGLADTNNISNSSIFGTSGGASSITATFVGGKSYRVDAVWLRSIDTDHPNSWGPLYTNDRVVQSSLDGVVWRNLFTISGVTDDADVATKVNNVSARHVRIVNVSSYFGISTFKFS